MNKIISSTLAVAVIITGALSASAPASAAGQTVETANVVLVGGKHRKKRHRHFKHRHGRSFGPAGYWGNDWGCHYKKYRVWSDYHGHHVWVKKKFCGHKRTFFYY
ncbi:MAG: hypothetical protein ABJN26_10765 [Stappiaceae bacterium]